MQNKKKFVVIPLAVLVFIIVGIALLLPNNWQRRKPGLSGSIWLSGAGENMLLHYVTEEERAKREVKFFRSRGPSDYITRQYSRYRLHTRSVETGQELAQIVAGDIFNAVQGQGTEILGSTTNTLWVWNETLEARDPATLKILLPAEEQVKSPAMAKLLPRESKYYRVSEPHQALLFKGLDTQFYVFDAVMGTMSPADETSLAALSNNGSVESGFEYLPKSGASVFHTSPNDFLINAFITETGDWYALLTRENREKLTQWPGKGDRPFGDVARSLYKTKYKFDGTKEIVIDPKAVEPVGTEKFIMGGFLKRKEGAVWDVPSPGSSLVLCKDALGANEPWQVVRLARDGSIIWKVSTGLPDFQEIADGGTRLIMRGRSTVEQRSFREGETLVLVDTTGGKVTSILIEGEEYR